MIDREISELRRRFRADRTAITHIYGCYVDQSGQLLADFDESLALLPTEEQEKYLELLKKGISGALGRTLSELSFPTAEVMSGERHALLRRLRDERLAGAEARRALYEKIAASLRLGETGYLILLASDVYDVPARGKDGARGESETQFSYFVCAVCPVKETKSALRYEPGEKTFRACGIERVAGNPELGFLFPAFDDRTANIYNALFYSRSPDQLHQEFIDGIFHVESPMSPEEQKATFRELLTEALDTGCDLSLAQAVHSQLSERIAIHKESRDPEPLTVSAGEMGGVLSDCGVPEEKVAAFQEAWGREFGKGVVASPENLIDAKRFELKSGSAVITLDPEQSFLIETRIIDGRRYLLIPADAAAELNGFPIKLG